MTINDLLPRLRRVKKTRAQHWTASCPAHEDRTPSLSVSETGNGKVLIHCFTGCEYESIISALGLDSQPSYQRSRPVRPLRRAIEPPPETTIDADALWRAWFKRTDRQQLDSLGVALGVDTDCLWSIGCAWANRDWQLDETKRHWSSPCWAFPMRMPDGKVVGIRLRAKDGSGKWSVKGGHNALFIPGNYSFYSTGEIYIVEGPTDLAAAMTIGLRAIGRPSCSAGDEMIVDYVQRNNIKRVVIVSDNDQPDRNGIVAGLRGAEKLQAALPVLSCLWIPPTKDLREFVNLGGRYQMMQSILKDIVWHNPARRAA